MNPEKKAFHFPFSAIWGHTSPLKSVSLFQHSYRTSEYFGQPSSRGIISGSVYSGVDLVAQKLKSTSQEQATDEVFVAY